MSRLSALVDLDDDGVLTVIDGLGWFLALSAVGLVILLTGTAVFAVFVWVLKGIGWTLRWAGGRVYLALARALHHATTHGRGATHQPRPS